jgi:hypothetical protein
LPWTRARDCSLAPCLLARVTLLSVRHVQERGQGNRVRHDTLTGRVSGMRKQGTARSKFLPAARVGAPRRIPSVSLDGRWSQSCEKAFRQLQEDIQAPMTTAHPDPKQRICVFADAFYSGMITQVPGHHLDLAVQDQQHQSLEFISGRFRGSQERWTIPEKEAFAVIETVTKHSYLLLVSDQFSILSDHFNLKYIYASLSLDPSLARRTVSKIQRWALKLATYNYCIEHIAGELYVWTDLLTRWGAAVTKTTSTPRKDSTLRYGAHLASI